MRRRFYKVSLWWSFMNRRDFLKGICAGVVLGSSVATFPYLVGKLLESKPPIFPDSRKGAPEYLEKLFGVPNCWESSLPAQDYSYHDANLILISLDTLRSDFLGFMGHSVGTPFFDRFAKDSIVFKNHTSNSPRTASSHASMLSGLIPRLHGVSHEAKTAAKNDFKFIQEYLKELDYATTSFNGGVLMDGAYGFERGFDLYESDSGDVDHVIFEQTIDKSLRWLSENHKKFFLFLHSYETHSPFTPREDLLQKIGGDSYTGRLPRKIDRNLMKEIWSLCPDKRLSPQDVQHLKMCYLAEIQSADMAFGRFVGELKRRGVYDNSMIVFTSDHGIEFGEHGAMMQHGTSLYEESIRAPLAMKLPYSQFGGHIVNSPTSSIDLLPTISQVLNIPTYRSYFGRDIIREAQRLSFEMGVISESPVCGCEKRVVSFKRNDHKLIYNPNNGGIEVYDLTRDPHEKTNLFRERHREAILGPLSEVMPEETRGIPESRLENEDFKRRVAGMGYI